jgi:hypothetical protein
LARQLRQAVYDIIDPPLPVLESWGIDLGSGCGVVLLRVLPSRRRPHRQQANKEVFVRRADESVRLSMREIQDLTMHAVSEAAKIDATIVERCGEHRKAVFHFLESTRSAQEIIWGGGLQFFAIPTSSLDLGRVVGRPQLTNLSATVIADFNADKYPCAWPHAANLDWRPSLRQIYAEKKVSERKAHYSLLTNGTCEISFFFKATNDRPGLFAGWLVGGLGVMLSWIERIRAEAGNNVEFALAPQISIFGESISLCRYGSSSFAEGHATTLPPGFHEFPIMSVGPVEEFPQLLLRFDEDFWNLGGYDTQRTAPSFTFRH